MYGLANKFNGSLDIVENMPLGPEPLVIPSSKGSYKERCQLVFNTVAKDKSAFIIIDYYTMSPPAEEIQEAKQSTTANKKLAQKRFFPTKKVAWIRKGFQFYRSYS